MARASRKTALPPETAPAGIGHNMSRDQKLCLALRHRRTFKAIAERKKALKTEEMHFGKVVKVDLGDDGLDQIKIMIQMETPEGKAKVEAKIAAVQEAKAWAVGEDGQFEMFAEKKPQGETGAFLAGKLSAMDAEAYRNPYGAGTSDHEDYHRGFERGEVVYKEMNARLEEAEKAQLIEGAGHDKGDLDEDGDE